MFRLLFLLFIPVSLWSQNPYEHFTYDSLVIYDFDWRGREGRYRAILNENRELPPTVKKSARLSDDELSEFVAKLGRKETYGGCLLYTSDAADD